MAHLAQRRLENVSGDIYVDHSCIDCDTCRWMAPEVFQRVGEQSALSCPTASIGTVLASQPANCPTWNPPAVDNPQQQPDHLKSKDCIGPHIYPCLS